LDGLPDSDETRVDVSESFLELLVFFFGPCCHTLAEGLALNGIPDEVYFF
jgi:hypothetical protein